MKEENDKNLIFKIIEWGVYLLVFLLPWQARMIYKTGELAGGFWEYGTFALYGTEILLLILVVLNLIVWIKKTKEQKSKKTNMFNKLFSCFLVFLFMVACLTIFWAQDSWLVLFKFVTLLEGFMFFWLIISARVKFRKLAWAIVLSGLAQAGLGIWQFLGQEIVGNKWLGMATQIPMDGGVSVVGTVLRRWLRAYGSLPHPNILGGWLVVGLVLCVGLYEDAYRRLRVMWSEERNMKREKRKRDGFLILNIVILLCCYIVTLFGLLCTFSRGAWVAMTIAILLYCFIAFFGKYKIRRVVAVKLLIVGLLIVAVFGFTFSEPFLARVTGEGRLENKSIEERINGYKEAREILDQNWLGGVGLGNYTLYMYNRDVEQKNTGSFDSSLHSSLRISTLFRDYQPVHNLWLLVWAELGVFGLLFFAAITLSIINYQLSIIRKIKDNSWTLISLMTLLTVIILSFFDHYFWSLYFGVMVWWMVLGLTFILRYDNME